MGTSKTNPNDWMTKNGTGKIGIHGGDNGWSITHANGQVEILHCMGGVNENPAVAPYVLAIDNPNAGDYSVGAGDVITFSVVWSEPVDITGTPQISFNENGVAQVADYNPSISTPTESVFDFTVTTVGIIDTIVESVQLNGGTVLGTDDGITSAVLTFNADYVQPTGVNVIV